MALITPIEFCEKGLDTQYATGLRLWLALRYLDKDGRGALTADQIKVLTNRHSQYHILKPRQLKNTLNKYNGRLWSIAANGDVYLFGTAKVAKNLGVGRIVKEPVKLEGWHIFGGLQLFKAVCYSGFIQGLGDSPVSRQTITDLTGIGQSTQQIYEKLIVMAVKQNVGTTGEVWDNSERETYFWQYGRAVFNFKGMVTWRLPNSYRGILSRAKARTKRKAINEKLDHLNGKRQEPGKGKVLGSKNEPNSYDRLYFEPGTRVQSNSYVKETTTLMPDCRKKAKLTAVSVWLLL